MANLFLTDETPPRRMLVKGTAFMDPDVWVAEFEDGTESYNGGKTFWIVKSSGIVVGLDRISAESLRNQVRAVPAQGIEAATAAETAQQGSVHESPVANGDAPQVQPQGGDA